MFSLRGRAVAAAFVALIVFVPPAAKAHFALQRPASARADEDGGKGPPPCADGIASNIVTPVEGGSLLTLELFEFVPHPGHYRIALSVDSRNELPPDPDVVVDPNGLSVSATIQNPPQFPILADGMFAHTDVSSAHTWQGQVLLPNINCAHCTLQVIEFMAEHGANLGGGYFYHHCADLQITAKPAACDAAPVITSVSASPNFVTPAANTATLSVLATTTAPSLAYQWFVGQTADVQTPLSNGKSQSVVVHPTATTDYWVRVSNVEPTPQGCPAASADSDAVSIRMDVPPVCDPPPVITSVRASPSSVTPPANAVTLSVLATTAAPSLSYQWFVGHPGDIRTPVPDGSSPSVVVHPTVTTDYWVRVTNNEPAPAQNCPDEFVDSDTVSIRVDQPPPLRRRAVRH